MHKNLEMGTGHGLSLPGPYQAGSLPLQAGPKRNQGSYQRAGAGIFEAAERAFSGPWRKKATGIWPTVFDDECSTDSLRDARRLFLKAPTDEELMLAYAKGDTAAFEVLLKRYEKGIFFFALRHLGSTMLAEEVTQESFLRVVRTASRYKPYSSFRNYLYRIARNLCFDLLRKRSRVPEEIGLDSNPGTPPDRVPNGNPGPESRLDALEVRSALHRALRSLPPEQREVFLLKEVEDMKLQDVARITGANLNTVKSRLRYALFSLREHLSGQGVGKEAGHGM